MDHLSNEEPEKGPAQDPRLEVASILLAELTARAAAFEARMAGLVPEDVSNV
jgi:hypothetical protein